MLMLMSVGCDSGDSVQNVETRESNLIIGTREVESTRGTFELVRNPAGYDPLKAYMIAASTRAAGRLIHAALDENDSCTPAGDMIARGSVVLTSDTRAITAFHVIRTDVESFDVLFESPGADFLSDTTSHPLDWRSDLRFESEAENPFLANRLFALSLANWVNTDPVGMTGRQELRNWEFEVDVIGGADPFASSTYANQEFLPLPLGSALSRDIVILKAREHTGLIDEFWNGVRHFPIVSPSVFFDQVEPALAKNGALAETAPVFGVGVGAFPGDQSILRPLALLRGENGNSLTNTTNLCVAEGQFVSLSFARTSCSLDSRTGLSGSAILANDRLYHEGFSSSFFLQAYGVLAGGKWGPDDNPSSGWGTDSLAYPENFTFYTPLGEQAPLALRDDPLPPLVFPPGGEIPCGHMITVVWEDDQGNQHDASVCSYDVYSEIGEHTFDGVEIPKDKPVEPRPDRPHDNIYVSAPCRTVYFDDDVARADPGYMYGIMGALSFGSAKDNWQELSPREIVLQNGGGLGSFFGICGPHTTVPYTSNWRYLFIKGNRLDIRADALEGIYQQGQLRDVVTRFYEERVAEREVTARPPSFKMCPPGSIMRGVIATHELNPVRYTGIRELICAEPGGVDTYHPTIDLAKTDRGYQIFGRPFDLSQFIGWPTGVDERIICSPGKFVRHLKFRLENGVINYLDVDCDL